jgi:hypothetical protein
MKIKIKYYLGTIINWFKSIKIWQDDKPIEDRYFATYFLYIGEGTIDQYKKIGSIAYAGKTEDAPIKYNKALNEAVGKDKYVIIFDKWNK